MRFNRLAILILVLAGCKATSTTYSGTYSEDLTIHRPELPIDVDAKENTETATAEETYTPLTGHIGAQLDSIAKIAYAARKLGEYVDGYIIQVYSGNSREAANEVLAKMDELFPALEAKMTYHQPSFRVKAGRFTDRLKANKTHRKVKSEFQRALLLPERFLLKYE